PNERALAAAGLEVEVAFPVAPGDPATKPLQFWGLAAAPARREARAWEPPRPARESGGRAEVVVHDPSTREALRRFLDSLTPGRAYPPGTLLSEAERSETRRRGDLDAQWLLAMLADGSAAGGLV